MNLLPLAKHMADSGTRINWICCDQFRDIFEVVPYVTAYSIREYDLALGVKLAQKFQAENHWPYVVTQIYQHPERKSLEKRFSNFQRAQWWLAGGDAYVDRLHEWPLEMNVTKWFHGTGIRHHVSGYTCPEYRGKLPGQALNSRLKFYDLGQQLANAELFIGVDSGPLYLAEAVGVPTIGLIPRSGWTAREPNPRWIGYWHYGE
jgi:ADP-heptose:LPS heptosyltransferase